MTNQPEYIRHCDTRADAEAWAHIKNAVNPGWLFVVVDHDDGAVVMDASSALANCFCSEAA